VTPDLDKANLKPVLTAILLLTAVFFMTHLARMVLSPVLPALVKELGLSRSGAGSLFIFTTAGFFGALISSGFIVARITHRTAVVLAAWTAGAALMVIGLSRGLGGVKLGLVGVGLAAGLYLPSGIATVTSLSHPRHWGKTLAIHELAPNWAYIVAPAAVGFFEAWLTWRGTLVWLGGAALAVGLAFALLGRGGRFKGQAPRPAHFAEIVKEPAWWMMTWLFILGVGASEGVFALLPLYLTGQAGLEAKTANLLVSLSRFSALGMIFLAGWASDRYGRRLSLGVILALAGVSTLALSQAAGGFLLVMVFVQPAASACFFPVAFAALSEVGVAEQRNLVVALTVAVSVVLGGGLIPAGMGYLGEIYSLSLGLACLGFLVLSGLVLLFRMDLRRQEA